MFESYIEYEIRADGTCCHCGRQAERQLDGNGYYYKACEEHNSELMITLEVLHHHAAAIDWLCEQLEARLGTDAQDWRIAALHHALDRWHSQLPDEMRECLERNSRALEEVMNRSV